MKTVLCICTYRRPEGLALLLDSLRLLDTTDEFEVVVVDNDAKGEGLAVCHSLADNYPYPLHALSALEPGISPARNSAASKALELAPDFIAFLDDDEWPEQNWLKELIRVLTSSNADVVGGPTVSVFPAGQLPAGQEYYGADLGLPDGAMCQLQAAGNFLIRRQTLTTLGPQFFDPDFAHSGGEDLAFFTQLSQQGAKMNWAANAIVHESVPDSRLSHAWLRRRVVNIHNSRVRVMQRLNPGTGASLIRASKTVALFIASMLVSLAGLFSPSLKQRGQLLRWKFVGKFTAHIGRVTVRGETY
ncbi:MAG: glycosyltransferase [Granulosicoccus sp.]